MDAQRVVRLVEDQFVVFLANAKTVVKEGHAQGADGGTDGEAEFHGGKGRGLGWVEPGGVPDCNEPIFSPTFGHSLS